MRAIIVLIMIWLAAISAAVDQVISFDTGIKRTGISKHNCILWIACVGLNNSTTGTGTGVEAIYGGGVSTQDPNTPDHWVAKVKKVEIEVVDDDHVAQIYPLESGETGQTNVVREFRFDSTLVEGSTTAVDVPIKITVTYHFDKMVRYVVMQTEEGPVYGWNVGETDEAEYELTFTPKAYNVALTNATSVVSSGGTPSGWQGLDPDEFPDAFRWPDMAQSMADQAASLFPNANYAMLSGKLHAKSDLIKTSTDSADRLTKLIAKSTAYFNSSHGSGSGFGDKDAGGSGASTWIPWEDVTRTTGAGIISTDGNLMNRIVYLYSCECGITDSLAAFRLSGSGSGLVNTALFGFNGIVYSTLDAGNTASNQPYNDSNGIVIMTDPLTGHVTRLLEDMAGGEKASDALANANAEYPPRTFASGSNGINYMNVLNMLRAGDADATLHKIYQATSETSTSVAVFGDWGLVKKALLSVPTGVP